MNKTLLMTKHRLVTILLNYNGFELTRNCLISIVQNEATPPFVILLDNNSKDSKRLDELHKDYPHLKIIRNEENIGFGRANNVGIDWAIENIDFEYLLLLNNDTIITENSLTRLTSHFDKPDVGIATCRIMYDHDRKLVWYGGGVINFNRGWPKIADFNSHPTENGSLLSKEVEFASGCLMMFSKNSIQKIKGFDNRFFMYIEDLELSIRCNKLGFKIWYDGSAEIYHKVQGSFTDGDSEYKDYHPKNKNIGFQFYEMKKNQWFTFRKHLSGWKFFKFSVTYWIAYHLLLTKLLVLSPYRGQVFKTNLKVLKVIFFKRSKNYN